MRVPFTKLKALNKRKKGSLFGLRNGVKLLMSPLRPLNGMRDATIAFYQLEGLPLQWVRSTSLLERVNRQLRRKFRQALSFGSNVGAEVALYLQVQRLHAQWNHTSWWQTSHALYFDLQQVHHVGIGRAFRPFPPSKRSMRLSPHCAFRTCPSDSFWTLSMQGRSLVLQVDPARVVSHRRFGMFRST